MMNGAVKRLIGKYYFVYLNDIIIFGTTTEEHNRNCSIVCQRLRDTSLMSQLAKCE